MAPSGSRKSVKLSPSGADDRARSTSAGGDSSTPQRRPSTVNWYPGVWSTSKSSKAAPVTEVARESISVAKNVPTSDLTSSSTPQLSKQHRSPSLQLTRKAGVSTRSLPADATTTKVNIASDGSSSSPAVASQSAPDGPTPDSTIEEAPNDHTAIKPEQVQVQEQEQEEEPINPTSETTDPSSEATQEGPTTSTTTEQAGWFSWLYPWSAPDNSTADSTQAPAEPGSENNPSNKESTTTHTAEEPAPQTSAEASKNLPTNGEVVTSTDEVASSNPSQISETSEIPSTSQKRSWLQMWYGTSSGKGVDTPNEQQPPAEEPGSSTTEIAPPQDQPAEEVRQDTQVETHQQNDDAPVVPPKNAKPSGWSFWFKEPSQDPIKGKPGEAQSAEISVAAEPSSKKLKEEPVSDADAKAELAKTGGVKLKTSKSSSPIPDQPSAAPEPAPSTPETAASKHLQRILPNQVLPLFKDTFALEEKPSFLQTVGRFLHYGKEQNDRHVYKIRDPPQIKRALAIGVHGYFPAPFIRTVLGQPTGTSIRFSNMAAESIRKYTEEHGYKCDIEKIALEGEGRIAERVDLLWKLLLNWMEEIRKADFILVACHSQGVPVAIMLVAKLIAFGCLNATRIGVCAMAGVNLGPFHDYRSRWISGSAGELFDFALPYSQVSKDYESALKTSLDFGVRISYVGSIDDQLVSLESSLFSAVTHPYIYRAVFVDGRVHAPSFLSHLVGFALKLRNLGIPDHGLIRELSSPLAGSLYTGDGHSRLYDDETVYRLAIEFALETSSIPTASINIRRAHPTPVNPYILPFAMRGLLEEEYVRRELYDETMELLRQFDNWKPTSKVLKDVKFRLEGIRSKL